MKKYVRSLLALIVCAAVLAWAWVETDAVGGDLQYLIAAPRMEPATQQEQQGADEQGGDTADGEPQAVVLPNQATLTMLENLRTLTDGWSGVMQAYTLSGVLEAASMTADTGDTKQARLTALGEDAFTLEPAYLIFGRLFYPEELQNGSDGILLDEKLALALFKIAQPIGRTVNISGHEYTVIGVLRHTKQVGDAEDYGAYVPLAGLWNVEIQLQALQVTARPLPGAGARSQFGKDMELWSAGGTLIDLAKESMGAMMPVRVLLFGVGCAVFFGLLGLWNRLFRRFFADYRERLANQYAMKLLPRLLLGLLTLTAGYGALALGAAALVSYIVEPVYTFTEWVPTVLVEWKDIQTAFWNVWQGAASLVEMRSPQLCRIRYFAVITGWFSAFAAVALALLAARVRAERRLHRLE
jgi:hypothetical protein